MRRSDENTCRNVASVNCVACRNKELLVREKNLNEESNVSFLRAVTIPTPLSAKKRLFLHLRSYQKRARCFSQAVTMRSCGSRGQDIDSVLSFLFATAVNMQH